MNCALLLFANVCFFLPEVDVWRALLYSPEDGWSVSVDSQGRSTRSSSAEVLKAGFAPSSVFKLKKTLWMCVVVVTGLFALSHSVTITKIGLLFIHQLNVT